MKGYSLSDVLDFFACERVAFDSESSRVHADFSSTMDYKNPFLGAYAGGSAGVRYRRRAPFAGARVGTYARGGNLRYIRRATPYVRVNRRGRQYPGRAAELSVEKKFYDTALAASAIGVATDASGGERDPSVTSMISTPAVGDNEQNRDGKKILIKSVLIKGQIQRTGSEDIVDPPATNKVMVSLVLDTQSNGAQMNSEDCYKNLSASVLGNATPLRNLLFANRFKVLKSEIFDLTVQAMAQEADNLYASAGTGECFEWYLPMSLLVNFNAGTTADIANVVDNSLHVIAYAVSAGATITYNARIRFQG